jgi:hypothetical protein
VYVRGKYLVFDMSEKIKIGISSCLLGNNVRYDGGHKLDPYLRDTLGQIVLWAPVCPEVEAGLTVPREPMQLFGDPATPRLITIETKMDRTDDLLELIEKKYWDWSSKASADLFSRPAPRVAVSMIRRIIGRQGISRVCARDCSRKP